MTPIEEEILLRRVDDLAAQNQRLQTELQKIADERARSIIKYWEVSDIRIQPMGLSKAIDVKLSPVFAQIRMPEEHQAFSGTAEQLNHLISQNLAAILTEQIEEQLK